MENDFKYKIWNLPSYIMKLESESKNLTDYELDNISGGIMNRKLAASVLAGLSALTVAPSVIFPMASAITTTTSSSQRKIKNQNNIEITKEQAIEDINYALKVIKDNHVSSVEKVPDEVTNQSKIEIENLPDKVSVIDEWRIISRIFSKLHDAHTRVSSPYFLNRRLPFDTKYEYGKFTCTSGDFKGYKIMAINDISIQDLYETFQNHYSYEIEEWTEHNFFETPSDFIPEWKLALCGIDTSKPIKVSFDTKSGIQSKSFEMIEIKTPNEDSEPWVSYEIDEKNSLAIFKLNQCYCNDEYFSTLLNFYKEVSDKKIKNIAIDLRKNVGGDNSVARAFALGLKGLEKFCDFGMYVREGNKISKRDSVLVNKDDIEKFRTGYLGENYDKNILFFGNVFLLTSHGSFSSAMHFATLFSDNKCATIVGEVPGNSPESFGDISGKRFRIPNSKLRFCTTYKKFCRPDKTRDGTKLVPDIQVPAKDALKKVYEIIDEENNYDHFDTEHFEVIYPKDEKDRCEKALKELEENYDKVTNDLKIKIDKKTKIKLFKTKDDFHKSEGCYGFPEYTSWLNGTAKNGFIKTHLELTPERIKEILIHEFTHIAVENINKGYIPFIFNDGIATYEAGQSWLKDNLPNINHLPEEPDWLIKGQFLKDMPQTFAYFFAYSFAEFIIQNYGYNKMIEFLKVDYQNNKFDFESVKDIYSNWRTSVLNH